MNRRHLFALMAGAIMTPEGLWVPGQKTIILPAKERYMGDVWAVGKWFVSPEFVTPDRNIVAIAQRQTLFTEEGMSMQRTGPWHDLIVRDPNRGLSAVTMHYIDRADLPKTLSHFRSTPARLYEYNSDQYRLEAA
jgi:hypothetical protein